MKNLQILDFLKTQFNDGLISKLNSIVFDLDEKYPSQISSDSLILNFDNLTIQLKPFGNSTYQQLKIGYSTKHIDGRNQGYKSFKDNILELNLKIIDINFEFESSVRKLIITCEDNLQHRFYCADYNTAMSGSFKSNSNQNLIMKVLKED